MPAKRRLDFPTLTSHLNFTVVRDSGDAIFARNGYFPYPKRVLLHWRRLTVPIVLLRSVACLTPPGDPYVIS